MNTVNKLAPLNLILALSILIALTLQIATASAATPAKPKVEFDKSDLVLAGYSCKSSLDHAGLSVCKKGSKTFYCKDGKCIKQFAGRTKHQPTAATHTTNAAAKSPASTRQLIRAFPRKTARRR